MDLERLKDHTAEKRRVLVVGGANIDIFGFSGQKLVLHDSNPGVVQLSPGGVGRNIAENLARLGVQVTFLTVIGCDANGRMLLEGCLEAGIDMSRALVLDEMPTSVYLALMDESGDMHAGINDMGILSCITPQYIDACADVIGNADLLVVDANLCEETIIHIVQQFDHKPIFADPISTAKALRMKSSLPRIHTLKPNALQAGALSGMDTEGLGGVAEASGKLVSMGVRRVFTTLGSDGVCCVGEGLRFHFSAPPVRMVNATGAGDAFTAGLAYAYLEGMGLRETAAFASALATLSVQSGHPISHGLNAVKAWEEFEKVLKEGKFNESI